MNILLTSNMCRRKGITGPIRVFIDDRDNYKSKSWDSTLIVNAKRQKKDPEFETQSAPLIFPPLPTYVAKTLKKI